MFDNRVLANRMDEEGIVVPPARASFAAAEKPSTSILTIIWRRRWVFFGCILVALTAAGVYLSKATRIYASSSQIYVQQGTSKILTEMLSSGPNPMNYFYTQCDMIKSTAILSAALEAPEVRQTRALKSVDNPVGFLKKAVDATVGKQSDVITVTVETAYPEDSALLANAVVDSYITYQNKQQRTTATEVLKILQKEKEKHEGALRVTSKAMLDFKRANGTLSFESDKGNIITQRLGELSNALTAAQLEMLDAKVLVDAATALGNDPTKLKQLIQSERTRREEPLVGIGADNQDLWTEFRRLKRAAEQAKQAYGPDHRLVHAYQQQLESLKEDMAELDNMTVVNYQAVINQQYVKAETKVDQLARALEEQRGLAMDLNAKATEYGQLESDARRAEKVLDILDSRIKELNVSEDAPLSISILEVARPSGAAVKPKPSQTAGIALVIGLMLGLGGALLQDWMDQRLRSVEEIRAVLELPVLGVVPQMMGRQPAHERGQEVHLRPRSNVAEAYRTVRTSIYFGVPDPKAKTLLVTSPSPGDGKTTMASNLAIAIAQSGRRVLLIDADTRKPMMHRIFNLKDDIGLSSVLLGEATTEQAVQRTGVDMLDILPCGPLPPNPSEILSSQAFLDLIDALSADYDQIVIDSPPVEPVTDARILAASCDVTILVLRAEKSTRRLSVHARDALIGVGANLLGAIVNAAPHGQDGYSAYSGYGYYRYEYRQGKNGHSNGNGNGHKEIKAITVASSIDTNA